MVSNPVIFVSSFKTLSALTRFLSYSVLSFISVAYDRILFNFTDMLYAVLPLKEPTM